MILLIHSQVELETNAGVMAVGIGSRAHMEEASVAKVRLFDVAPEYQEQGLQVLEETLIPFYGCLVCPTPQRAWYRTILMRGLHVLVSILISRKIRDTQCGELLTLGH